MFFSSSPRLPCKERIKDVDGNFTFFVRSTIVCYSVCCNLNTRTGRLCLSLFSSPSLSTGSLDLFKRHRVGGWRILGLLWKTWMWAQLSLRLLEQLYDHSRFSVTFWGLIVSQNVRLSGWLTDSWNCLTVFPLAFPMMSIETWLSI